MTEEIQVVAFSGSALCRLTPDCNGREAVLALPLSRLLVRMLRVPAAEDPVEFATPVLKALSPFPDEPLTVSCEIVRETPEEKIIIAAALPEGSTDDLGAALDAAKLSVVRVDILELGALRAIWGELNVSDGQRRLVRLKSPDGLVQVVLDGDQPCSIRALADASDLSRETTLSLLEAEDFNGPREVAETLERDFDANSAAPGVCARAADGGLNALPESWRDVLDETRFKRKLTRNLIVAGGIWLLILGVLFGVPVAYGFMTDHIKGLCRDHARQFRAVSEKKEKVKLVQRYSDHSRGALELMKAVSDRLPEGITLTSWDYRREEGLRLRGDSDGSGPAYAFKEALDAMGEDDPVFKVVKLGSMNAAKDGIQRFDVDCRFEEVEE